jgi:hypothetical protein
VALTSPRNSAFCAATGYHDRGVAYDAVRALPTDETLALIGMAGNAAMINARADHLGFALVWGREGYAARRGQAWIGFKARTDWLKMNEVRGVEAPSDGWRR